jgi:hypothetical protein
MKLKQYRYKFLQRFISVMMLTGVTSLTYAQTLPPNLRVDYKNNLLTVSAQKADLKNVLLKLSDKTGIYIRFPSSLKKQITTELFRVPLSKALSKILEGTNYAIIYSGSGKNRAVVSKIFVYRKSKRSRKPGQSISQEALIASRIKTYEKRIELMNKKLSQLDKNSRIGQRYLRQVKSYETIIENLKRKIQ